MATNLLPTSDLPASVSFADDQWYKVQLPRGGDPANVALVLLAVTPRIQKSAFDAGQLAADFIACVDPKVRCRLANGSLTDGYLYRVTRSAKSGGPYVDVTRGGAKRFEGELVDFTDWARGQTGLEELLLKTVQFAYDGGTKTVRVDKVEPGVIEGYDLATEDLKTGYRKYLVERIVGSITIVN